MKSTMNRPTRRSDRGGARRNLRFESLENRTVLNAASPFVPTNSNASQLAIVSNDLPATARAIPLSAGESTETAQTKVSSTPIAKNLLIGDTDGDGRDDILTRRDGDWLISQSAGGGHECQFANVNTDTVAELPRQCVDTAIAPPLNRAPIVVPAGGDLQVAINEARPGDIIELEAGATYRGRFTIPPKVGDQWIHVRSSRHAELPAPGTRIDPTLHAALMPKIVASGVGAAGRAIDILPGAHHWRFEGIEITSDYLGTDDVATNLVILNAEGVTSVDQLPHHIIFDHMYLHGNGQGNILNGIRMDGRHVAVVDSYLTDFLAVGRESHAVYAADGAGPIKIVNNHLEAAGVNIIFGGDDPVVPGLVNEDIEIRGNLITKREEWRTQPAVHKFLLDLKNARRVLVTENILENSWDDGRFSDGSAILVKSTNQEGACIWCVAADVTISQNILRDVAIGVKISGRVDTVSERTERIVVENNLFYELETNTNGGGKGTPFVLLEDYDEVHLVQNTTVANGQNAILLSSNLSPALRGLNLVVRDNLLSHNQYGVKGSGTVAGLQTLDAWVNQYTFTDNVVFGNPQINTTLYPAENDYPTDVEFVDANNNNFRLQDSNDAGVDYSRFDRTACIAKGQCLSSAHVQDQRWGGWSESVSWFDVQIADVNGDGLDDIVGRAGSEWWVSRSTVDGFVNEYWGRWADTVQWQDVLAADVNGDGKSDIVGRAGGQWWVARSTGTRFVNEAWGRWSDSVVWRDVHVGDVNGDGKADIIGRNEGDWWVAKSTGTRFSTDHWGTWSDNVDWRYIQQADVNGDGLSDVLAETNGEWWAMVSDGSRFATQFRGRWSNVDWQHVTITDLNGDGRSDIIGRVNDEWWAGVTNHGRFEVSYWGSWSRGVTFDAVRGADVDGDGKSDLVGLVNDQWRAVISGGHAFV